MDDKTIWSDLGHSGIEKDVFDMGDVRDVNVICPKPNNFYNYNRFKNKPQINGVILEGNKTTEELGIHEYDDTEIREMISDIEDEQEVQDTNIANNAEGIEEINRGLVNYSLVNETGYRIDLEMDSQTFDLVAKLYDKNGNLLSTSSDIDLPLESLVVSVEYDSVNKEIVITLESGEVTRVPVGDLVEGLVSVEDLEEALEGYYTKTETDNLLSPINSDISDLQDDIDGLQSDIDSINAEQTTQNENIAQNAADISTLNDDLANYSLITETGSQVALTLDNTNYKMKVILKDKNGNTIYTSNEIDLPMESVVINGFYDNTTKEVVLTLVNGSTIRFSVASLVSGLVSDEDLTTILGNYYTSAEIDTLLVDYVKNTDYATSDKAGVIKATGNYGVSMQSSGQMYATNTDYSTYQNASQGYFVGKGTLENVIVGKELVNQETLDESQAEQDINIEENASNIEELQNIVDQLPHETGEGTDIKLEPTIEAKMSIGKYGSSSQFSTDGKQLFDLTKIASTSSSGITATINENTGEIELNGTSTSTAYLRFDLDNSIPAGTIVSYGTNNSSTKNNCFLNLALDGATKQVVQMNVQNAKNENITLNTDINRVYIQINRDITLNNFVIKPMLNVGNVLEQYESYTGGIPAPSPDYSFMPSRVTGENSIVLQNENLFIPNWLVQGQLNSQFINNNSGFTRTDMILLKAGTYTFSFAYVNEIWSKCYTYANATDTVASSTLFNSKTSSRTETITLSNDTYVRFGFDTDLSNIQNDATIQLEKGSSATPYVEHEEQNYKINLGKNLMEGHINGWISSSRGTVVIDDNNSESIIFYAEKGQTYTMSSQVSFNRTNLAQINTPNPVDGTPITNFRSSVGNTFTSEFTGYCIVYINDSKNDSIINSFQIEKGSTATEYAPYFPPIELNSSPDGTIRDGIIGTPNNWFKREYIGKIVLDGSENMSIMTAEHDGYTRFGVVVTNRTTEALTNQNGFCNNFQLGNTTASTTLNILDFRVNGNLYINTNVANSIELFREWLASNNVVILHPQIYNDIPITDTTLISQLNDIYNNAHSYNGVTNITTTYEDGNEQMYLDVSAMRQADDYVTDDDLADYVKNTDYVTNNKAGIIKISSNVATSVDSNGYLTSGTKNYSSYTTGNNSMFISKGTLENVITGKDLTTKAYVDGLVGDISDVLDAINGENLEGGA